MDQYNVPMGEWFFTQALVGYKRILENYGETVKTTRSGLIVEKRHLEILPDALFEFFLNKYSVAKREERVLRALHKRWKETGDKKLKSDLNKRLKATESKVQKYFEQDPVGKECLTNINQYRNTDEYQPILDEWLEKIVSGLRNRIIDDKLTSNFFKAVYYTPYVGQVSFLNVTHNSKTLEEQKQIFYKDFIDPIFEEWTLVEALEIGDETVIRSVLNGAQNKGISSLKRALKKKTLEEIRLYIDQDIHRCTLTDFPLGLLAFEEGVFSPLALSLKQAINMTWESSGNMILPISSLARLILFCAPAGTTISEGKSVFLNYDGTFDEIYQSNEFYTTQKDIERSFDEIVFDLVREQKMKADLTQKHYLIFEYESDYQSKKTLLDYMVMTPNLVHLFQKHERLFGYIHFSNRRAFVRALLKDIDTRVMIHNVLREKIKNHFSSLEVVYMLLLRHFNKIYQKEGLIQMDAKKESAYIWTLYKSGEALKQRLGDKKAQGIAYRLLNAIRSGNKHVFLDTVMRVYISCDMDMPTLLLQVLHEEKMDFETVAEAWVTGLIAKPENKGEKENAKE